MTNETGPMTHTETPWMVGGPHPSVSVCYCVDPGCGYPDPSPPHYELIAMFDDRTRGEPDEQAAANAAFTVECVNAHAALLAERDRLREACKTFAMLRFDPEQQTTKAAEIFHRIGSIATEKALAALAGEAKP